MKYLVLNLRIIHVQRYLRGLDFVYTLIYCDKGYIQAEIYY